MPPSDLRWVSRSTAMSSPAASPVAIRLAASTGPGSERRRLAQPRLGHDGIVEVPQDVLECRRRLGGGHGGVAVGGGADNGCGHFGQVTQPFGFDPDAVEGLVRGLRGQAADSFADRPPLPVGQCGHAGSRGL